MCITRREYTFVVHSDSNVKKRFIQDSLGIVTSNSTLTRIDISINKEHRYFQTGSHKNISRSLIPSLIFQNAVKVPFGAKYLDATLCCPASVRDVHTAVILTHGAGGDMNFRHLVSLAHALASYGFICLRFTCKGLNLGYRVKAYHAVWVNMIIQFDNIRHFCIHVIECLCCFPHCYT